MKSTLRLALVMAVALVVVAGVQPASAFCSNARLISPIATSQYIISAGQNTVGSIHGSFWAVGNGNPLPGLGIDNGSDQTSGNVDSNTDWVKFNPSYPTGPYLAGTWGNAGVDGCIDAEPPATNPKRTVVAFSDVTADGAVAYFGVFCKEANADANYDFSTFGNTTLAEIPYPKVNSSSRVSGSSVSVNIRNVASSIPAGSAQGDPSCTGGTLVHGYKVCTQTRPNASGRPPSRLATSGWVCGSEVPAAQDAPPQTIPCGPNTSVWMALQLVYENGLQTEYVSRDVRAPCDPTLSDRPSNFKLIKKPKAQTPRHEQ